MTAHRAVEESGVASGATAEGYGAPIDRGTPVCGTDGGLVGVVEAALGNYREDVATGVIFRDRRGDLRFCHEWELTADGAGAPLLRLAVPSEGASELPTRDQALARIAESGRALGERFARALAALDRDELVSVLHPRVFFRAVTPGHSWHARGADEVIDGVLPRWFWEGDELLALEHLETGAVADRARVGYRIRGRNAGDGEFVFEQQAYVGERDGRIGWLLVMCSGFRPVGRSCRQSAMSL